MIDVTITVYCDKCKQSQSVTLGCDDTTELVSIHRTARQKFNGWIVNRMVNAKKFTLCRECNYEK